MAKRVRKAVFPVAGLGTRFLPVTKAMPKEMLPVVDKPLIQYAFEEATAAGIEECYFVTGRAKNAIEDHFDTAAELEMTLRERGKDDLLNELDAIVPTPGRIAYTRQQRPLGLGHAVWCARHLVGDEPFAVLLADDLMVGDPPCLAEMVEAHARTGGTLSRAWRSRGRKPGPTATPTLAKTTANRAAPKGSARKRSRPARPRRRRSTAAIT